MGRFSAPPSSTLICVWWIQQAEQRLTCRSNCVVIRSGLKDGGAIRQHLKKVSINCPDYRIPKSIVVRIGGLKIGDAVKGSDLQLPEHAQLVTAAGDVVVELYDPRKAV